MNSKDTEEISETAFIISLLIWTLWSVDFGVHMFQWEKDGSIETSKTTQQICSNEWQVFKEIEKIKYDLEPEIVLGDDEFCSLIFSVSEHSISFVHYLHSPQLRINTYFFDHAFSDSLEDIEDVQNVQIERTIIGDTKSHVSISDHLTISDSLTAGEGIRIYIESVLLPLGARAEKIKPNI